MRGCRHVWLHHQGAHESKLGLQPCPRWIFSMPSPSHPPPLSLPSSSMISMMNLISPEMVDGHSWSYSSLVISSSTRFTSFPLHYPSMDLLEELEAKLDFSHGKKFRKEILQLFGSSVHHTSASPSRSFLLLAAFRHYTFCLSEESVTFALASC